MGRPWLVLPALAVVTLMALLVPVACATRLGSGQRDALRAVFRDALRLEPPSVAAAAVAPPAAAAPRHMLELYERYAAGGGPRRRLSSTVRSFMPAATHGVSSWPAQQLVFNVSAAGAANEEVTRAHLHLRRRRSPSTPPPRRHRGRALPPPARVRLLPVHQGWRGSATLASVPVSGATRGGWVALDVTAALRELLLLRPPGEAAAPGEGTGAGRGSGRGRRAGGRGAVPQLAVRFEGPRGRALPPAVFLQGEAPARAAFLVVFSEDATPGAAPRRPASARIHTHAIAEMLQSAGNADEGEDGARPHEEAEGEDEGDDGGVEDTRDDFYLDADGDEEINNMVDASPSRGLPAEEASNALAPLSPLAERRPARPLRRPARSVLDNELPGAHAPPPAPAPTPPTPRRPSEGVQAPRWPPPPATPPRSTLPLPGGGRRRGGGGGGGGGGGSGSGRRGRGRGRGRRRGGRDRHRPGKAVDSAELREGEYSVGGNATVGALEDVVGGKKSGVGGKGVGGRRGGGVERGGEAPQCQRKKLVVDFSDIGWGEFIVAPRSFEAHYCSGDCSFPIAKALRPTNHATLQSLVRAIGRSPDVPAPCCVPDHLSSLALLYLDAGGNVVLKNYRNMKVDSCACR